MDSATLSPSCNMFGSEQMGTQKISVFSDQANSFNQMTENSDSFVLDIESFDRDITPKSRIIMQRNLSRKGPQRGGGGEKKDTIVATSSPTAGLAGTNSTPGSPMAVMVGTTDHLSINPQPHHQITIATGNITTTSAESKSIFRRNSFKRSPSSWTTDPRKILLFFATLSSMGTLLLIFFTLSVGKFNEVGDGVVNWTQ